MRRSRRSRRRGAYARRTRLQGACRTRSERSDCARRPSRDGMAAVYAARVLPGTKDRVFRDPVHGLIELRGAHKELAAVLDTRAMQRLRRIKQMGWAWL